MHPSLGGSHVPRAWMRDAHRGERQSPDRRRPWPPGTAGWEDKEADMQEPGGEGTGRWTPGVVGDGQGGGPPKWWEVGVASLAASSQVLLAPLQAASRAAMIRHWPINC